MLQKAPRWRGGGAKGTTQRLQLGEVGHWAGRLLGLEWTGPGEEVQYREFPRNGADQESPLGRLSLLLSHFSFSL